MTSADDAPEEPSAARASTHLIRMRSGTVTKTYRVGGHDRAQREWRALHLLAEHAPGAAPAPIRIDLTGGLPTVVMARLPGVPLHAPLTSARRIGAMATAVATLHAAVPPRRLTGLTPRAGWAPEAVRQARAWFTRRAESGYGPVVDRALKAGWSWSSRTTVDRPGTAGLTPVFGTGDGNLANHLWDGERVRIVDFEFSGRSDRAFELAEVTEHVSMWVDGPVDVDAFLSRFDLTAAETTRLRECRRLLAYIWLLMLSRDAVSAAPRNPHGTAERQAARLQALLG